MTTKDDAMDGMDGDAHRKGQRPKCAVSSPMLATEGMSHPHAFSRPSGSSVDDIWGC